MANGCNPSVTYQVSATTSYTITYLPGSSTPTEWCYRVTATTTAAEPRPNISHLTFGSCPEDESLEAVSATVYIGTKEAPISVLPTTVTGPANDPSTGNVYGIKIDNPIPDSQVNLFVNPGTVWCFTLNQPRPLGQFPIAFKGGPGGFFIADQSICGPGCPGGTILQGCCEKSVITEIELCPPAVTLDFDDITYQGFINPSDIVVCEDRVLATGFVRKVTPYIAQGGLPITRVECIPVSCCIDLPGAMPGDVPTDNSTIEVECAKESLQRGNKILRETMCVRIFVEILSNSSESCGG